MRKDVCYSLKVQSGRINTDLLFQLAIEELEEMMSAHALSMQEREL